MILTDTGDIIFDHARQAAAMRPNWPIVILDGGGTDVTDQLTKPWADAVAAFVGPDSDPDRTYRR